MADQAGVNAAGTETVLDARAIDEFQKSLRGAVLRQGDAGYDAARTIHNGMIDRRPALVARCTGVADVVRSVKFARESGLLIAVRGGGHGVAGHAVCDGGLMIDLSLLKSVHVDAPGRVAEAGGGATWGDFDHETQVFGLATTGGVARPTGIAGLTLGGGHGYLMRRFGLASDNLISADVVTAEGVVLTASANENPDLFWALRGGGGNFGVVTSFRYRLYPVSTVLGGLLAYPIDGGREFLRVYRDVMLSAPDELGAYGVLATLPDGSRAAVLIAGFSGEVNKGENVLRPFRKLGPILVDQLVQMPYTALQSIGETVNPRGMRNYWKTSYLKELSDDAISLMLDRFQSTPHPQTHVVIERMGGAVARADKDGSAVDYRDAPFNFLGVGMWADPGDDHKGIQWIRELWAGMQPHASGAYVNYESEGSPDRLRAAYSPKKLERLTAVKRKYDPANVFRQNLNIKP